ncbi:hypothetical protein WK78_26285 [Burkholderia cepacia]|uniref:hypothetical protein n=1 Tax=Burkholderia cepacia TaxID=292 RepID=UPI00076D195D|nr:hypothetical protein [Burkholderia cepacia]KVV20820.1 hypothetical protein WK78_26285 [Burkholderia cepacia]
MEDNTLENILEHARSEQGSYLRVADPEAYEFDVFMGYSNDKNNTIHAARTQLEDAVERYRLPDSVLGSFTWGMFLQAVNIITSIHATQFDLARDDYSDTEVSPLMPEEEAELIVNTYYTLYKEGGESAQKVVSRALSMIAEAVKNFDETVQEEGNPAKIDDAWRECLYALYEVSEYNLRSLERIALEERE